jgi:hypothetical protein
MLSRALSPATVMLLIGCFAAVPALAQAQNLEAGKSPSQIFAGTCSACHKSPRGLLKTVPAGSLPGFLRQHYTTSSDMASLLSAFLISNGATDTRYVGTQPRPDKDAKSEAKPAVPPEPLDRYGHRPRAPVPSQEAARPDTRPQRSAEPEEEGLPTQAEPGRRGRSAQRLARPGEAPDAARPAVDNQAPVQATSDRGPDGRKSAAKQRLSKRGKLGGEELPKTDAAKTDAARTDAAKTDAAKTDAAKTDAAKTDATKTDASKTDVGKTDTAKTDAAKGEPTKGEPVKEDKPQSDIAKFEGKPEGANPPGEGNSDTAKIEPPKQGSSGDTPALRADPVPPVTPAPQASPTSPTAVSSATPEHGAGASGPAAASAAPPPAVAASVPPPAPVAPAGPPAPPISQ